MTSMQHVAQSAILAGVLLSGAALAQDRVAIFAGSGESAEVLYVSPSDPRARSALGTVVQDKAPVIAMWDGRGEEAGVFYMEQTSARIIPSPAAIAPQRRSRRTATYVGSGESAEVVYTETFDDGR